MCKKKVFNNNCRNFIYKGKRKLEQFVIDKKTIFSAKDMVQLNEKFIGEADEFIKYADILIEKISNDPIKSSKRLPRVMIAGSVYAPVDIFSTVEECGGNVVLSDNCNGIRNALVDVDEDKQPLMAIAQRYLQRPVCARYSDTDRRLKEFSKYVDEYSIDAVILSTLKFCTDQSYDVIILTEFLKDKKIPFLVLDSEYPSLVTGQINTRIQAFLERL